MKKERVAALMAISAIVLLGGSGCDSNSFSGGFKDLEGVTPQDPEQVVLMNNVDGFPNVVGMCINGAGFATTTREQSAAAMIRVEEWDASKGGWCAQ